MEGNGREEGRGGYISVPQFANEHVLHPGVLNDIPARKSQDVGCFFFLSLSFSCSSVVARFSSNFSFCARARPRIFF